MGFASACKQFFGLKPNQTMAQFAAELRELTPADKLELWEYFQTHGLPCDKPIGS